MRKRRYRRDHITGGRDTDKNIMVAAIYHADTGDQQAREFHQHRNDALRAVAWFQSERSNTDTGKVKKLEKGGNGVRIGNYIVDPESGEVINSLEIYQPTITE